MKLIEIFEALDKAVDYEVTDKTPKYFAAEFDSNGRRIKFDADGSFAFDSEDDDQSKTWEIAFIERDARGIARWDATKGGKEFEVFATLRKIVEQFFREYKPEIVKFTSDKGEGNRAELYQRMFKRLLPAGYRLERDDTSSHRNTKFLITKT